MLTLRPLTTSDVPALSRLQSSCYPPSLWDTEDELRELVSDPSNLAIGAFDTIAAFTSTPVESIIGAVMVKVPGSRYLDRTELYSIEVMPKSRHRGVGRRLLKEALRRHPGSMVAHCTADGARLLERSGRFERTAGEVNRNGAILQTFVSKDREESEGGARVLTILLVAAAVLAILYLVLGREKAHEPPSLAVPASPEVLAEQREEAARMARTWATQLEMKVTGVTCSPTGLCTIAREPGLPFTARCSAGTCVVDTCPR